jgi:hypothetical protein
MERLSKSALMQKFSWAVDHSEDLECECVVRKTNQQVLIKLTFKEQETFTDKNGIKWVRA